MSRSLAGFLLFCVLLVSAGAAFVWYVGPTASAIAFDGARRDAPYYVLQLLVHPAGGAGQGLTAYREGAVTAAAADGGRRIWSAEAIHRYEARARHGSHRGGVAAVDVLGFARGAGLLQMLTGPEYRALASAAEFDVLLAGTSVAPQALREGGVAVVVLYELVDPQIDAPLGRPGESGWLAALEAHGGSVAWDAGVDWVRSEQAWNRLAVLQFADPAGASAWLNDPVTQAGRALASRHLGDLLVLVARPSN